MTMEVHSDGLRTGRSWTNDLWATCPWQGIGNDPGLGFRFFTDFVGENAGDWTVNSIGGTSTVALSSGHGGWLTYSANSTTDAQGGNLGLGAATSSFVTPSASTVIFYEILCKLTMNTGGTVGSSYIGLSTQPTTSIPLGSTGAMATSIDRIGFNLLDSTAVRFNYLNNGATAYAGDSLHTAVEATWMKLGFRMNGLTSVTPYVNSVRQSTIVATSSASLPDGVMNVALSTVNGASSAGTHTIVVDWLRIACHDTAYAPVGST